MKRLLIILLATGLLLTGCGQVMDGEAVEKNSYTQIDQETAKQSKRQILRA